MPPAEQEARNGQPLHQMFTLEPCLEFGLAARAAIVPDCEDTGVLLGHHYFAATTMISTL